MAYQIAQAQHVLKPPVEADGAAVLLRGRRHGRGRCRPGGGLSGIAGHAVLELARLCWISVVGSGISAVLLIDDFGRPERFLNMLRVFRPSLPMVSAHGRWPASARCPCRRCCSTARSGLR